MIVGVGIDLIETARIQASMERFGERFLNRVFLPDEIAYSGKMRHPARHFAARFAAKEAASKAFGTGIGRQLGWRDMEVCRNKSGEPYLVLHGKGAALAKSRGITSTHVSLTHHMTAAAAVVILCSTRRMAKRGRSSS